MIYTMASDEDLTSDKLREFIDLHKTKQPRYELLKNMYLGRHQIINMPPKEMGKPDNRLVVNFAKYIVDTLNGYFIGHPVKTIHPDATIADKMKIIAKRNSQNDNNAELSKLCSIYGHAYEFIYQDEDANTRVTYLQPQNSFVIYDDTIARNPLYGVHAHYDDENKLKGHVYSRTGESALYETDKGEYVIEDEKPHYYGDVPIIEYVENEERQAAFEGVISLIDAYNKALSEKANDVDYFADAYLAILGVELDEETIKQIRDNRVINLKDGDINKIIVEFLDKPNADVTQENLINRLQDLIFQITMTANINDESFGNVSGISLKYKLQPMENVALMKERKFTAGMMRRFKMMFNVPMLLNAPKDSDLEIDYVFSRNIPNDLIDEAEAASKLEGITSKRTQLSVLSVVDSVQDEMDEIKAEEPKRLDYEFGGGER